MIERIASAIREAGADLRNYSADSDHHRCVMTLLGNEAQVFQAALAASEVAFQRIDLRTHEGVHPRTGVLDVLPIVPLRGTSMNDAVTLASRIAEALAEKWELPVYLYEKSAKKGREAALPAWRKEFSRRFAQGRSGDRTEEQKPDYGPCRIDSSKGIAIVGAREPLAAYNINLKTEDQKAAQEIARRIRQERETNPDLRGIRALGLSLPRQKQAQVSMNLTQPYRTPLPAIFDFVFAAAADLGVEVEKSEIIGVIPPASLNGESPERILWKNFKPSQILRGDDLGERA